MVFDKGEVADQWRKDGLFINGKWSNWICKDKKKISVLTSSF
jgi:hypothetical protein